MKYILAVFTICLMACTTAKACDLPIKQPFKFVSLWNNDKAATLENLNQIKTLCETENYSTVCLEKNLKPTIDILPLYTTPDAKTPFGAIEIRYSSGEGARASYFPLQKDIGSISPFQPDMHDGDWGYGPYFHQTMLDNDKDWYQVPVPDSNKAGWIKLPNAEILLFAKDDIITFKDKNYTILEVGSDSISFRDEQPADMWCQGGSPPKIEEYKKNVLPLSDVYDQNCHLLLKKAYTRGC